MIVTDWLANLPSCFLNKKSLIKGGGVIQTSSSGATFIALLCAKTKSINRIKQQQFRKI